MDSPDLHPGREDIEALLRRTQLVDPTVTEEAVDRFAREVAEMEAALGGVEIADAPLAAAFSPSWPEASQS
jgi:hypothetical protein